MSVYATSGSGNVHTDKVMSGGGKRVATTKAAKPKAKKPAVKGKFPVAAVAKTPGKQVPGKPMGAKSAVKTATKPVVKKVAAKRTGRRGGK
jgi:hypothetical protein